MPNMDSLPQEVIDQILAAVRDNLGEVATRHSYHGLSHAFQAIAPLATISPTWRRSVERLTFKTVRLYVNDIDFEYLLSRRILGIEHRRQALRELVLRLQLPTHIERRSFAMAAQRVNSGGPGYVYSEPKPSAGYGFPEQVCLDARADEIAFTHAVFKTFSAMAKHSDCEYGLWLLLEKGLHRVQKRRSHPAGVLHFLNLNDATMAVYGDLPLTRGVKRLHAETTSPVNHATPIMLFIHPDTLAQLLKLLPDVKDVTWGIAMPPRQLVAMRAELRDSLVQLLGTLVEDFPDLECLDLRCEDEDPYDHAFKLPNYIEVGSPGDKLSLAVHQLSQLRSLRELKLGTLSLSDQVFSGLPGRVAAWQSLERCTLTLSQTRPSGDWYFSKYPTAALNMGQLQLTNMNYGSMSQHQHDQRHKPHVEAVVHGSVVYDLSVRSDEAEVRDGEKPGHPFRRIPDAVTFTAFVVAAARAVAQMPKIRELNLVWEPRDAPWLEVTYYAPGFIPEPRMPNHPALKDSDRRTNSDLNDMIIDSRLQELNDMPHLGQPRWVFVQCSQQKDKLQLPEGLMDKMREVSRPGVVFGLERQCWAFRKAWPTVLDHTMGESEIFAAEE
ncbi:hypothetical protein QBC34DRAFT_461077 [Podospora aff. communis PSN243]|uniref:F-box domain-containing protein n=1 Tax=Podospora aff. communis PSN243 TaxID=3040156 RepID=A0AAV9GPH0_9PEZI|nr:hypothetical protein QBC34DRAFT_461077 [Podospora aff. communis PSN243]